MSKRRDSGTKSENRLTFATEIRDYKDKTYLYIN